VACANSAYSGLSYVPVGTFRLLKLYPFDLFIVILRTCFSGIVVLRVPRRVIRPKLEQKLKDQQEEKYICRVIILHQ